MRLRIEQLGMIGLVVLMLFSTTGIAIYPHICGCQPAVIQSAQFADDHHSCCQVPETPVCCTEDDHSACDTEDSHKCTDEVTYLKVPIVSTTPMKELTISVASLEMPDFRTPDIGITDGSVAEQIYIHPDILPPQAGRPLFIFLHQLKIPFPEDLS